MGTVWFILVAFHACLLCWYVGVHPLSWLGLPDGLSLLLAVAGWWLWSGLLGSVWWLCLAISLFSLSRLGRWAWGGVPFIWCWGLWLFEQLPVGLPWVSPGVLGQLVLGWTPMSAWLPEAGATVLLGLLLTRWVQQKQRLQKPLAKYHLHRTARLVCAAMVLLALLGGLFQLLLPTRPVKPVLVQTRHLAVWPYPIQLLQPNTPIATIRGNELAQHTAAQSVLNTMKASPAPPGSIWLLPEEGALPGVVPLVDPMAQAVYAVYQKLASARGWFVVVGATTQTTQGGFYNSMLLIQPQQVPQVLHKRRLVPFGEMAPLGSGPLMQAVAGYLPSFQAGSVAQSPFQVQWQQHRLTLWPLICSEALYADLWPASAPLGTKQDTHGLVVVGANLGWFQHRPNPWLAFQWQQLLTYRAKQTGWPVLSVANQGPTF
jgi:apolipoprotein N-acyltransferase